MSQEFVERSFSAKKVWKVAKRLNGKGENDYRTIRRANGIETVHVRKEGYEI